MRRVAMAGLCALGVVSACSSASAQATAPPQLKAVPAPRLYVDTLAEKYFPGTAQKAPAPRIFRLTRDQLDATVRSLLPTYVTQSVKTVMARDPLQTNYEYAELLSVNAANFGGLTGWIGDIAGRVRAAPAAVINCPKTDSGCQETAARGFNHLTIRSFSKATGHTLSNRLATRCRRNWARRLQGR